MSLFQTIPGSDWSTLDDRVWQTPGAIVDLGCHPWNWSRAFFGRKPVIGVDPLADYIPEAMLWPGVIGPVTGVVDFVVAGESSSTRRTGQSNRFVQVPQITWSEFKAFYHIGPIAALKVNIEGGEYALDLFSHLATETIDQLAISFHHRKWPTFTARTREILDQIRHAGYTVTPTNVPYDWFLCVRQSPCQPPMAAVTSALGRG